MKETIYKKIFPRTDNRHFSVCKRLASRGINYISDYISWDKKNIEITVYCFDCSKDTLTFLNHLNFKKHIKKGI